MDKRTPEKTDFRDMGIIVAITLIFFGLRQNSPLYTKLAFGALLISLIVPILYKPLTIAWFAIGLYLSKISSFLILTVIYVLVLLPVALLMRLAGRDLLKIKEFKKGSGSVFTHRNHRYTEKSVIKPY